MTARDNAAAAAPLKAPTSSRPPQPSSWTRAKEVARLAVADVAHEWRMSLCLMLAVAAIAAPLLLFFGLKNGTMETLRMRLLENPVNMEIIPNTEKLLDAEWFARWSSDPRVAFVVPHTRRLSAQADLRIEGARTPGRRMDLRPTGHGDMLLSRYGCPDAAPDTLVLTAKAAEQLKASAGSRVELLVSRDGGRVKGKHVFSVAGILPVQASAMAMAFLPLAQLEMVEAFKDGRAVPEFGWPGTAPVAYPVLDTMTLVLDKELDPLREALLLENTGFSSLKKLPGTVLPKGLEGRTAYSLSTRGAPAGTDNVGAVRDKLRGQDMYLLPRPSELKVTIGGTAYAAEPAAAMGRLLPGSNPPGEAALWTDMARRPAPRILLAAPSVAEKAGGTEVAVRVESSSDGTVRSVEFPARLVPDVGTEPGTVRMPAALLATLNLLRQREIAYGESNGEGTFLLGRRGYSGFRMYAAALEDVAPVAADLEAEGIAATTKADRIAEVRMLDKYLGMLFWIIAAASLAGGVACLVANMYAGVERKRKELAVLRLLGVHGASLAVFPLVNVTMLTLGGLALSMGVFHGMSYLINSLFSSHLEAGESFCRLGLAEQAGAMLLALLLALTAGLAAAARLSSIQASESLRDE